MFIMQLTIEPDIYEVHEFKNRYKYHFKLFYWLRSYIIALVMHGGLVNWFVHLKNLEINTKPQTRVHVGKNILWHKIQ